MAMDLTIHRYEDFSALDVYCYRVAGTVGLMMAHVFGFRHDRCLPHAEALGSAMQLTNILRDVREDSDRGRIYLPLEEMGRFGVSEIQIAEKRFDGRFGDLMKFQIARARQYYQDAEQGIPDLIGASSRLTVRLMGRLYAGILGEIERLDLDVFRERAVVPKRRKAQIAARCVLETLAETTRLT